MNTLLEARLRAALHEADAHQAALAEALADWQAAQPVDSLAQLEADKALKRLTDQILFRLMKLQDALGLRLIPATLGMLAEPYEGWPMQDRLSRLEKLGYLDATQWLMWGELRNRLAHEYPDDVAGCWANLQQAVMVAGDMLVLYGRWRKLLQDRGY